MLCHDRKEKDFFIPPVMMILIYFLHHANNVIVVYLHHMNNFVLVSKSFFLEFKGKKVNDETRL